MSFDITSAHTNYTYNINVYVPEVDMPEGGFSVVYVLDGSSYFQFVKEIVRLQSINAAKTEVFPSIIVGVGHGEDMRMRRFYDFTAPAESYVYPEKYRGAFDGQHGGAENFSRFLEEELKPIIQADYPVNTNKQVLFGHSLGGYFALWQLFNAPTSYHKYIAISPSIWWNNHELFQYADTFLDAYSELNAPLFVGVGGLEEFMVDDAQKMAQQLGKAMDTTFYVTPDENHGSVVPTIMSRAFRFVNN
ncbi:alpha/beta hydrolase [Metasolibacillus meyeri]|uniref:alpha/beta hydrolase n=1 Tax=Metasolibacillus meyeri TaxID=1071052 RepID=UPI000D31A6FE|nr:alpha/beta hydrolase-fold protein [Metasolibacillus meyeri]